MEVNNNKANPNANVYAVVTAGTTGGILAGTSAKYLTKIKKQNQDAFVSNYRANLMEDIKKIHPVDNNAQSSIDGVKQILEEGNATGYVPERFSALSASLKQAIEDTEANTFENHFRRIINQLKEQYPTLTQEQLKQKAKESFSFTRSDCVQNLLNFKKNRFNVLSSLLKFPNLPTPLKDKYPPDDFRAIYGFKDYNSNDVLEFFEKNKGKVFGVPEVDGIFTVENVNKMNLEQKEKTINILDSYRQLKLSELEQGSTPEILSKEISDLEGLFEKTPNEMREALSQISQKEADTIGITDFKKFQSDLANAKDDKSIRTLYETVSKAIQKAQTNLTDITSKLEEAMKLCDLKDEAQKIDFLQIAKKHPIYSKYIPQAKEGEALSKEQIEEAVNKIKSACKYEQENKNLMDTIKIVLENMADKTKQATDGLTNEAKEFGENFAENSKTLLNRMKSINAAKFSAIGAVVASALAFILTKLVKTNKTPQAQPNLTTQNYKKQSVA